MKRQYRTYRPCGHDGCNDGQYYNHNTRRSQKESRERWAATGDGKYYCSRHHPNGKNLTPESERRVVSRVVKCVHPDADRYPSLAQSHTWDSGSGYVYGDNFNAYAEDFPIGATIVITTTIEVVI